jgi:hypothetical protein
MRVTKNTYITMFISVTLLLASFALAKEVPTPKYSANVPQNILTPDKVKTKFLGDLEFFDGLPSKATVKKAYDFLDLSRGVETFLNGMPAASMYAMLEGGKDAGLEPGDVGIFEDLMDARSLFLTPNTSTQYIFGEIDLKNGPIVVDIHVPVLGLVDDAFFRYVTDIGFTGPDRGKGGKYLFVGPDYKGEIPKGYFVVNSSTYRNWLFLRVLAKPDQLKAAAEGFKKGFNCYPLALADNPPKQKFLNLSGKQFNTIHANDGHYYDELNAVIQYEPADAFNPELVGLFASIGIKKGKSFAPDARMKKILDEAAAIGNASARAITFSPRDRTPYFYPDRQWYTSFAGGHDFMNNGEMNLNDRIMFHYGATGITPAMAMPKVGMGSAYEFTPYDAKGNYLDGGKTYSIILPGPVPAKDFWSFMVYSPQHRSMLETDQKSAGIDSNNPALKANDDGSYTIWFGPKAPEGHEDNWVQTIPGKGFIVILRLYGPLQPWFDKSWKPGDFELVK